MKASADDGGEHQQPASLGEQEELDCRVDPALVPPDGDQEIHGNQHQFPEEEEQEEIERQEDADDARQGQHQIEMEEAHALGDLAPGGEHRHDAEPEGQKDQQQAQAIQAEMKPDAELRNPRPIDLGEPCPVEGDRSAVMSAHSTRTSTRSIARQTERQPARQSTVAAPAEPREHAADEWREDEPEQDHANTRIAMRIMEPAGDPGRVPAYAAGLGCAESPVGRPAQRQPGRCRSCR